MTLEEFKRHTADRVEASIRNTEQALGHELPRILGFRWISPSGPVVTVSIEDEIARLAYVDENHIFPCIDIGPSEIDTEGRLIIGALRAGCAARPFGKNWKSEDGPFILIYSQRLADSLKSSGGTAK